MPVSTFDLFKIGIGPSSSHTVGPMIAARQWVRRLQSEDLLPRTQRLRVELYGSLSATGRGHGTDRAIVLGLQGEQPDVIDPDAIEPSLAAVRAQLALHLLGSHLCGLGRARRRAAVGRVFFGGWRLRGRRHRPARCQ